MKKELQKSFICFFILTNTCFWFDSGPTTELPVKVTGNIHSGFTAEFTPRDVGVHSISVEYNGHPVNGTPFLAKAFNADKVLIGPVARGNVGQPTHFTGKLNTIINRS